MALVNSTRNMIDVISNPASDLKPTAHRYPWCDKGHIGIKQNFSGID